MTSIRISPEEAAYQREQKEINRLNSVKSSPLTGSGGAALSPVMQAKLKREAQMAAFGTPKAAAPTFRESNGVIAPASNGSYTTLEDAGFYGDARFETPKVGQKGNPYVKVTPLPNTTPSTTGITTTGDPEVDAFTQQLMNQLDPVNSQLTSLYGDLNAAKGRANSQLLMDLQNQKALYDQLYAPRFDEAMAGTERAKDASNLSAAFSGSVRGSRQEERLQDLEAQGNKMLAALEAEKAAQLRLDEAVLRGATDQEVESLQNQIAGIQTQKAAIESTIRLAEENLLAEQYSIAADREKAQAAALKDLGYVMNPLTGELEETLVAQEKYAQILNTNAETAKLVDAVTNKQMDIYDVRADENGNSTAILFDPYTGEVTTIALGKLDPARAAALTGYRGSGSGSGSSGGAGEVDPTVELLMAAGFTTADLSNPDSKIHSSLTLLPSDRREEVINGMRTQERYNSLISTHERIDPTIINPALSNQSFFGTSEASPEVQAYLNKIAAAAALKSANNLK